MSVNIKLLTFNQNLFFTFEIISLIFPLTPVILNPINIKNLNTSPIICNKF